MVIGYHLILSAYGFWLPNDPRGSWSTYVGSRALYQVGGRATKVSTTRSVAHVTHDRELRLKTKRSLKRPSVRFTGRQAQCIGQAFAHACSEQPYPVWACAVLPDHAHLVIGRCGIAIERMAAHFKARATLFLRKAELWEPPDESPWAHDHWGVFVDSIAYLHRAVRYVSENPQKAGLRPQRWSFVKAIPPELQVES